MESSENEQVINLVQAMLGSISWNMRAISLACSPSGVTAYFLLEHDRECDREEIEDIVFEFEALQLSNVGVDVVISVSERPPDSLDLPGRTVYLRKEDPWH